MLWGFGHGVWMGPGFGFPFFPFILFYLFVLLVLAIAGHHDHDAGCRNMEDNDEQLPELETALEILKKRYARGEITKRQFAEMKKDIG